MWTDVFAAAILFLVLKYFILARTAQPNPWLPWLLSLGFVVQRVNDFDRHDQFAEQIFEATLWAGVVILIALYLKRQRSFQQPIPPWQPLALAGAFVVKLAYDATTHMS